jgi:heavy metal efflux system protein
MIQPTLYGQAIIILVYVPLLTFSGVEGKMFEPMALTVILALASALVLSLTAVPALIAILVTGRINESENAIIRALKRWYAPALAWAIRSPLPVITASTLLFLGSLLLFARLGQEFIPTLDEKNIALHSIRIPSTSLTQSQAMQFDVEKTVSALPEVAYVFSKTGTAETGLDPMPPNVSDTFVILKPRDRWPDPDLPKGQLIERVEESVRTLPGNSYEFTQPIQMRFNELLAGVRGDIAIKVFGDEFEPMLRSANQIAAILRRLDGAADVRVEQATGLPFLEIAVNKAEIARRGLSLSAVQDLIGAAVGGREAGVVFEGDRRFEIVVRLPDSLRSNIETLKNLPVPLPTNERTRSATIPLKEIAVFTLGEGPNQITRENSKRRVVVTANVRGRDIASLVAEAQHKIVEQVRLPPGYWIVWGGQFENLAAARQRLMVVVPACFLLIFFLLYTALGSSRDALLVFSAVPLAMTGGAAALWLRDMPFLGFSSCGLRCAFGRRRAQRISHVDICKTADRVGPLAARCDLRGGDDAVSSSRHDGAGRLTWFRANGARHGYWCRSAKTAGNCGHWRIDLGYTSYARGPSRPLCNLSSMLLPRRSRRRASQSDWQQSSCPEAAATVDTTPTG